MKSMRLEDILEGVESHKELLPYTMDAEENSVVDIPEKFEYVYGWNRFTMRMMGIWPEEYNWHKLSSYRALIPGFWMLAFICLPQSANLFFIWGDFDEIVENLSLGNMSISMAFLKNVIFCYKRKPLMALLECMAKDWKESEANKKDREAMIVFREFSRMISIKSTWFCQVVVNFFLIFRLLQVHWYGRLLLFRAYFPFNYTQSPAFEVVFSCQFTALMFAGLSYTAVDTFVAMLVLHVCGQLSNLQRQLREQGLQTRRQFQMTLSGLVQKHEYLNRFSNGTEDCFNVMLLAQMLSCTIQIGFAWFQAMEPFTGTAEFSIVQLIFLIIYITYVMLHLYLYCYLGEQLLLESRQVVDAAYECDWYNLSPEEARSLIIIMCRAKTPFKITGAKFCTFTVELFSEILKKAMGYLSVLYAMQSN